MGNTIPSFYCNENAIKSSYKSYIFAFLYSQADTKKEEGFNKN